MTKAWIVYCGDEWVTLIHADTRGKAIANARQWIDNSADFIAFRATRFPEMDDRKFTYQDCKDAGFEYDRDDDGKPYFWNDCSCDICEGEYKNDV